MAVVLAIVVAVAAAWLIAKVGAASIDAAVAAFAQFVGGWRGDGWPRGVQEEDPDLPWGRAALAEPKRRLRIPELKPNLSPVKPSVHRR
jgi:hypothetical protein